MPEFVPRAEAVEATKRALQRIGYSIGRPKVEGIIAAFCEEEGMTVETLRAPLMQSTGNPSLDKQRLVGKWWEA